MKKLALLAVVALAVVIAGCGGEAQTNAPSKKPNGSASAAGVEDEARDEQSGEHFTKDNWDLLVSNPDSYRGATVEIVGKVFLTPERDGDGVYFQMWADPQNSEWNTVVAYADPSFRLKDGDYARVTGTVKGEFEGENAFGASVTVPAIVADSVSIVDATQAASPAERTLGKATWSEPGVASVTVERVEIASDETRVFLDVKNLGNHTFSLYSFEAKMIVDGTQYDSDTNFEYPELSSEVLPGASTSGVMVFPPISTSASKYELHMQGSSENYDVGDYGTLKWRFGWR